MWFFDTYVGGRCSRRRKVHAAYISKNSAYRQVLQRGRQFRRFQPRRRDGHRFRSILYAGPKFTERHEYYPAAAFDIAKYSENFFAFTYDVNHDGWTDIIIIGFPGKEAWWFDNPHGKKEAWERYVIWPAVDG